MDLNNSDKSEQQANTQADNRQGSAWSSLAAEAYTSNVACYGTFTGPAPDAAFRLNPPQIAINGGMVVFNQPCDDDRIKKLPNFKPDKI